MIDSIKLKGWHYREHGEEEWQKSCDLESNVAEIFPDLQSDGIIPDPFMDLNERKVQWVGERDWDYESSFKVTKLGKKSILRFEGLDTFVKVSLNGTEIGKGEDMFELFDIDVSDVVKIGQNVLRLEFESALLKARKISEETGFSPLGFNGEANRMLIRKAQYHYGWDWGPLLATCGPCRPITFITYDTYVSKAEIKVRTEFSEDMKCDVFVDVPVEGVTKGTKVEVSISLKDEEFCRIQSFDRLNSLGNMVQAKFEGPFKLWFPMGYGDPCLHDIGVKVFDSGVLLQEVEFKYGIRKSELVQEKYEDQEGSSFYFRVNGIPVYTQGANWIPAHNFQTLLTKNDYKQWLDLAANGNQNIIRIWGGGYYEQDCFYEYCDELGLMIWHDFMFGCGQYPGDDKFRAIVEREVRSQLKRLRNHCSIVLWCGNNEDYQVAEEYNLTWDKEDLSGDYSKTNFPARTIYEVDLPKYVKELTQCDYHPGSPWGGSFSADPTVGDKHEWNVWHGTQEPYQNWYKLGGRYVSEFGMLGFAHFKTYEACITDPAYLYPQSEHMVLHNKAAGAERRLALYVFENIKVSSLDLRSWIYATQLMQSECLSYAYRCWRRNWKEDGKRYSGGTIVWQLNDCWPTTSWAICDYFKRPKLSYYAVKRESQPVWLGFYRQKYDIKDGVTKWEGDKYHDSEHQCDPWIEKIEFWIVNSTLSEEKLSVELELYDVETGKMLEKKPKIDITAGANGCTDIPIDVTLMNPQEEHTVLYGRLYKNDKVIARVGDWPQPLKYLNFPEIDISIKQQENGVMLSTNVPVKGIELYTEDDDTDIYFEDNGFDLFPNDPYYVPIKGLKTGTKIQVRHYF